MNIVQEDNGPKSIPIQREKDFLITKKEAAIRLAISVRTLDRLVARGVIKKVFLGASVRFKNREVSAIVEQGI